MQKKELLTEVTNLAKEEEKSGKSIELPSQEELVKRSSISFIKNKLIFAEEFAKLSSKGKNRVMSAVLDLPIDSEQVLLRGEAEKHLFGLGQRLIMDRYLLTSYYIQEQMEKNKLKQEETRAK